MNTKKLKKLLILNVPYFLVGAFATNLGEAWRIADGSNMSEKVQGLVTELPCHDNVLDLIIGVMDISVYGDILHRIGLKHPVIAEISCGAKYGDQNKHDDKCLKYSTLLRSRIRILHLLFHRLLYPYPLLFP